MPLSSLRDPADLARAQAALDAAWDRIRPLIDLHDQERERIRLSYIIASFTPAALDEDDLIERAWKRFWQE